MSPEIIALSSSEVLLGSTIIITSSGGEGVVSTSIAWACNSHTGTANLGSFSFTEDTFEPYCTSATSMDVVFTMTSTYSDGTTGTSTATCKVNIPEKYSPAISVLSVESSPLVNGHIRAGSSAKSVITFNVEEEGSATTTVTVSDVVSTAPVTYSISGSKVTFTLPETTTSSGTYTLSFKLVVTDSRGRTDSTTVSSAKIGTIYCYDAPKVTIDSITRCDSEGVATANGLYALIKGTITDTASSVYSCKATVNGTTTDLTISSGSFSQVVGEGKLDLGIAYTLTVAYISVYMNTQGYDAVTVSSTIDAQKVPFSLLDNGSNMGASFGEMAQTYDDTSADDVVNFTANSEMRASDGGNVAVETAFNVVNARKYITETVLGNLKFVAISEDDFNKLKNKDYETIYFVY